MSFFDRVSGTAYPDMSIYLEPGENIIGVYRCHGGDMGYYMVDSGYMVMTESRVMFIKKKAFSKETYLVQDWDYGIINSVKYKGGMEKIIFINGFPMNPSTKRVRDLYKDIKRRVKELENMPKRPVPVSTRVPVQMGNQQIGPVQPVQQQPPPQQAVKPPVKEGGFFCKYCGTPNDADARFCFSCGKNIA
ncbi:MAG: zinc ribbon domain-containing protein [Candidatus Hodarchaeota archaeon]